MEGVSGDVVEGVRGEECDGRLVEAFQTLSLVASCEPNRPTRVGVCECVCVCVKRCCQVPGFMSIFRDCVYF